MLRPEKITNIYSGPTRPTAFGRTYRDIENCLSQTFDFNSAVERVVKNTVNSSHKTLLDLGCGNGTTLKSMHQLDAVKSNQRKGTTSFELKGFTDAHSPADHGKLKEVNRDYLTYSYSLTAAQTLARFFEVAHIKEVHFAWAAFFFMYLSPSILDQTFNSMIDRLVAGGEFLVVNAGGPYGPYPAFEAENRNLLRVNAATLESGKYSLAPFHNYLQQLTYHDFPSLVADTQWANLEERLRLHLQQVLARATKILPNHVTPAYLECLDDESFADWYTQQHEYPVDLNSHPTRVQYLFKVRHITGTLIRLLGEHSGRKLTHYRRQVIEKWQNRPDIDWQTLTVCEEYPTSFLVTKVK